MLRSSSDNANSRRDCLAATIGGRPASVRRGKPEEPSRGWLEGKSGICSFLINWRFEIILSPFVAPFGVLKARAAQGCPPYSPDG